MANNITKTSIPMIAAVLAFVIDGYVYLDFFYGIRTGAAPSEANKFFFSWGWAVVGLLVVIVFTCATLMQFTKRSVKIFLVTGGILALLLALPWFFVNFLAAHFKP